MIKFGFAINKNNKKTIIKYLFKVKMPLKRIAN